MKRLTLCVILTLVFLPAALRAQAPPREQEEPRMPSGSLQRDEILKEDHRKNLDDAGKLFELAEQLKIELEKNDRFVLSLTSLKKIEEIEKLAKRIRGRLKRL